METKRETLIEAVMFQDSEQLDALIADGAPLEATDHKGQTALIIAAKTDQFVFAEKLLAAGADPFAVSEFGWTAGYAVQTSRLTGGEELEAKERVSQMLEERGYAMPGPDKPDIKKMVEAGKWPPQRAVQ